MSHVAEFTGMTWSHPRGFAPMRALAEEAAREGGPLAVPHSRVRWCAQSLAGFESRPVAELAQEYDLLILDHPGLGQATRAGALLPLEDLFTGEELERWRTRTVGRCYDSYLYDGHQLAVPVDAAAQVAAYRPDLVDGVPDTWAGALALSPDIPMCIPTAGPHTLLTTLGLAAAVDPGFTPTARELVPGEVGRTAVELLRTLVERTPDDLLELGPIEILDRMHSTDSIAYCPLVFGYVGYSRSTLSTPVRFVDAPALTSGGTPGSVLGGAGLAVSVRTHGDSRLLDHVRQAMDEQAQRVLFPAASGQPSSIAAWEDEQVNHDFLDFYTATRRSLEGAWRRPRFDGWITIQSAGSRLLFDGIRRGVGTAELLDGLNTLYRSHRGDARAPL